MKTPSAGATDVSRTIYDDILYIQFDTIKKNKQKRQWHSDSYGRSMETIREPLSTKLPVWVSFCRCISEQYEESSEWRAMGRWHQSHVDEDD